MVALSRNVLSFWCQVLRHDCLLPHDVYRRMSTRLIAPSELPELLRLYAFLNPEDPVYDPVDPEVQRLWSQILDDKKLRYFGATEEGKIVATCVLTLIPNFTRALRPYGLIENVVTDPGFRRRGFATEVLHHALDHAWQAGCYKVMLQTGSKREETLRFYEKAGFHRGVKTGFVAYPDEETG